MADVPLITRLERSLYTAEGHKYDHTADKDNVTALCNADHALRDQLIAQGYVVKWAIDGQYRLTDRGRLEMERRRSLARTSRVRGEVQEFPEDDKHLHAVRANTHVETEEERRLRDPLLGAKNAKISRD